MNMMWDVPYISEEARQIITGPRLLITVCFMLGKSVREASTVGIMRYFGNMLTEKISKFEHSRIF